MKKALHEGPWFIIGGFLSVTKWEPNFVPCTSTITHTAIWVRLPQLRMKFYDQQILERIGMKLGLLLRIDSCTSSTLRGRYAQICIQIPLENPVKKMKTIENHTQTVEYEGVGILCTEYDRVGHTLQNCSSSPNSQKIQALSFSTSLTAEDNPMEYMWKLVNFYKRRTLRKPKPIQERNLEAFPSKYSKLPTIPSHSNSENNNMAPKVARADIGSIDSSTRKKVSPPNLMNTVGTQAKSRKSRTISAQSLRSMI